MADTLLSKSLFIHVSRSGGSWVGEVLRQLGLCVAPLPHFHTTLEFLRSCNFYDRNFRFAFVRHPLQWYRSFYRYCLTTTKTPGRMPWKDRFKHDRLTEPSVGVTFEEFMAFAIKHRPGWVTGLYERQVGVPGDEIEFIGRYETLRGDYDEPGRQRQWRQECTGACC